jgi:lipid II:glycine glycyltransferase (peptidoglycan interpeptide bridge formation enzyme)
LAYTTQGLENQQGQDRVFQKTDSLITPSDTPTSPTFANKHALLAGIFLIFWADTAYYWIAGATKKGKKLRAPTLLVWEALKIAKANHMKRFDFVGIWDDRFPKENKDWLGFTKFKQGFGGQEFYYPTHRTNKLEQDLT